MTRGGRRWGRRLAVVAGLLIAAALANAYGRAALDLALDLWGPDFCFYDNGLAVRVKAHRLPGPAASGQAGENAGWPEAALRPAARYTLNLMGLSGPEGGLWTAAMRGQTLVVTATSAPVEVARLRVLSGTAGSGLAVVELDAGPNGVFLMELFQPRPDTGWFIVRIYNALDGLDLPWGE